VFARSSDDKSAVVSNVRGHGDVVDIARTNGQKIWRSWVVASTNVVKHLN